MTELFTTVVPMIAFMLIPIWIPLITVTVGWVYDLVTGARVPATPAWQRPSTTALQTAELNS